MVVLVVALALPSKTVRVALALVVGRLGVLVALGVRAILADRLTSTPLAAAVAVATAPLAALMAAATGRRSRQAQGVARASMAAAVAVALVEVIITRERVTAAKVS